MKNLMALLYLFDRAVLDDVATKAREVGDQHFTLKGLLSLFYIYDLAVVDELRQRTEDVLFDRQDQVIWDI